MEAIHVLISLTMYSRSVYEELILLRKRFSFSSDAVVLVSHMIMQGKQ